MNMKACVDIHYRDSIAAAACLLFHDWPDAISASEHTALITNIAPYEPGHFFRRELPCILAVLEHVALPLEALIVDGYVWLSNNEPGLGAHLFDALDRRVPVIGVAKTRFLRATNAREITRGRATPRSLSQQPASISTSRRRSHPCDARPVSDSHSPQTRRSVVPIGPREHVTKKLNGAPNFGARSCAFDRVTTTGIGSTHHSDPIPSPSFGHVRRLRVHVSVARSHTIPGGRLRCGRQRRSSPIASLHSDAK